MDRTEDRPPERRPVDPAARVAGNLLRASATDREASLYAIGFACALEAMGVGGDDAQFVINDRIAKGDTILHRGMLETGRTLREAAAPANDEEPL